MGSTGRYRTIGQNNYSTGHEYHGTGDPITVLHVDDDAAFTNLSSTDLQREGDRIDVLTETSVGDAVTVLDTAGPAVDCIVSDHEMPGVNGLEFLESVRRRNEDLPIIFVTGKGSEEIASEATAAGVTEYLRKSGTEQYPVLANRIVNAVEQYRSARRVERTERPVAGPRSASPMGCTVSRCGCERTTIPVDGRGPVGEFRASS